MNADEKTRLRTAFNTVTAGMDAGAVKVLEKRAATDTAAALSEFEALAALAPGHVYAVAMRGDDVAMITLPIRYREDGTVIENMLAGAVIRL